MLFNRIMDLKHQAPCWTLYSLYSHGLVSCSQQPNDVGWILKTFFFRFVKWGTMKLSNMPKITHLLSGRVGIWILLVWLVLALVPPHLDWAKNSWRTAGQGEGPGDIPKRHGPTDSAVSRRTGWQMWMVLTAVTFWALPALSRSPSQLWSNVSPTPFEHWVPALCGESCWVWWGRRIRRSRKA